jgi:uncharacterized membrane protein YfcA
VVFFNALSGSETYAFMKRIDYKSGLIFATATIPGAIIGALNTSDVSRHLFNGIFAVLLIGAAVFLSWRPKVAPRSETHVHSPHAWRIIETADGERYYYNFNPLVGIGISLAVGYLSSFLGIGGGIIHVPALVYFLDFPVHIATATSQFMLAIMALSGTLVHIGDGSLQQGLDYTLCLAIGVLLGSPVGAQLSSRLHGPWIIRSLALALGVVGIRIALMFLGH